MVLCCTNQIWKILMNACPQALTEGGMNLKIKDDVAEFLGVHIDCCSGRTINMTQIGLTDRIITALNIGDMHAKTTPAEFPCLGKDKWGYPLWDIQLCLSHSDATVPARKQQTP
jgi:hypothetical protein